MKKIISLALIFVTIISALVIPANAAGGTFSDVSTDHWAYSAIEEMAAKGIVAGTGDGKFSPDAKVTAAQFATMMTRTFYNSDLNKSYDEASSAWYGTAMHVALEKGIINGIPAFYTYDTVNGKESWSGDVDQPLSRVYMALMMFNYLKDYAELADYNTVLNKAYTIPDIAEVRGYYWYDMDSVVAAVYLTGCLSGVDSAGTFNGTASMTRAQACVVLSRMINYVENNPKTSTSDEWYITNIEKEYSERVLLSNGKVPTAENILELITSLKSQYPDGTPCDDNNFTYGEYDQYKGCGAFAEIVHDAIYGADNRDIWMITSMGEFEEFDRSKGPDIVKYIRVGDHIRINNSHSVIVIAVDDDSVTVVEGNNGGKITWGREISKASLAKSYSLSISRHVPYL